MTAPVLHTEGEGAPLLLLHGAMCDQRYWAPQMAAFGRRYRAIAPSLRHFWPERWDGRGDDFTIRQHTEDVAAFVAALGAGPVHLVGHSRGTLPALALARRHPGLLRSLTLLEPPPYASKPTPAIEAWWSQAAAILDADHLRPRRAQIPGPPDARNGGDLIGEEQDGTDFLRRFFDLVGAHAPVPDPLPRQMQQAVALLRRSGLPAIDPS